LLNSIGGDLLHGITVTAPGFYSPQGREVRAKSAMPGFMDVIQNYRSGSQRITNLEMETAGIYGLAASLGHKALSLNVILANRITHKFSKQPAEIMDKYIQQLLQKLTAI